MSKPLACWISALEGMSFQPLGVTVQSWPGNPRHLARDFPFSSVVVTQSMTNQPDHYRLHLWR